MSESVALAKAVADSVAGNVAVLNEAVNSLRDAVEHFRLDTTTRRQ